jgi:hypothetical protein
MSNTASRDQLTFPALADCCRLWLGTETSGALTHGSLDLGSLGRLAFVHNLEPLLHHLRAEQRLPRDDVPAVLGERWEKAYFENFVFNTRALELLGEITDACSARGIPVATIKGPVVISRVYRDPALRVMADLDLLCREQDLAAVMTTARDVGFRGGEETAVHHSSLQHRELNLMLELHFDLYDFLPGHRRLHDQILDLAQPLSCGDVEIPALPREFERVIEIAHIVNHDLKVNLKPLLDLAADLRGTPPAGAFAEILQRWDLEGEYELVAVIIDRLFGTDSQAGDRTAESSSMKNVDTAAVGAIGVIANIDRWGPPPALQELATRPGIAAKIAYLVRLLMPPKNRIIELSESGQDREKGGNLLQARTAHLGATFRRGWRKLRSSGLAGAGEAHSVKRQIYARRRR